MNKLETEQARLNKIAETNTKKIAIVLEGRDSAGKSGTIREVTQYLNPDWFSVCLSSRPTESIMNQWLTYWRGKMPRENQIVFYDRSWYSRALCQRVNGWCTDKQYRNFMAKVLEWEDSQDIIFIKTWLSISEREQLNRLTEREISPLKYWKLSPNDKKAVYQYDDYTIAKGNVFDYCGKWHSIDYNDKKKGRYNFIKKINDLLENV
jgi:polyphosphate kinase 2 (PPK2 family)